MAEQDKETPQSNTWALTEFGGSGKTVWEWMELFIVPIALTLITLFFTWQMNARQQANVAQSTQDTALQAYLDQMGKLLLEKDLRKSEAGSEVRLLARARTLTVLTQLEADPRKNETGKEQAMEFLIEAELIQQIEGEDPVISLEESDLVGVDLDEEALRGVNLKNALLRDANFRESKLEHANLELAKLEGANLEGANLKGANLKGAFLRGANLEGATMPDGSKHP